MFPFKTFLKTLVILILISGSIIWNGCASKGSPGGGPVDKTAPQITYTFPSADSVNVKDLSVINVHFSEPIEESSIANNIFISPPLAIESEWQSDSELNINIIDSLKENQTYVIVFGAKIKDIRNNKMASSYQLAFSTGPKINEGTVSGRVYGAARNTSVTLFAYELKSDSIDFTKNTPDYVSQSDGKNRYKLRYLREGHYRIFAVDDKNNDLRIDINQENIGIPYRDVIIDSTKLLFEQLNFRLTKIDTLAPRIAYIRPLSHTQIDVVFSEKVKLDSLSQLVIQDSITGQVKNVLTVSENIESDNILEVYTQKLDSGKVYTCATHGIKDSSGNVSVDTSLSFVSRGFVTPDSFKIIEVVPKDSTKNIHPQALVLFEFSNPINKESLLRAAQIMTQQQDTVKGLFEFTSAYEAEFRAENNFERDSFYTIQLDLKNIKNIWGDSLGDSLYNSVFQISSGENYGEIAGQIQLNAPLPYTIHVAAVKVNSKDPQVKTRADKDNNYLLKFLTEGTYRVNTYLDLDSNNVFSNGNLFPFRYSEPFAVKSDSVKVRKRWETSDINLKMPEVNNVP